MTVSAKLIAALDTVSWNENVAIFSADPVIVKKMAELGLRLAIWSRQFENIEGENPAICFIREMQVSGQLVAVSTALASYKCAAAALRTIVETALYYSYFRTHLVELSTLLRDDKWYISKAEILDYHVAHTAGFVEAQKKLPVAGVLNPWYSRISAIVHGQIPGAWISQRAISDMVPNPKLQSEVLTAFVECVDIVDRLFFCTVGRELWDTFSTTAKKALTHGMPGDLKNALGLDTA